MVAIDLKKLSRLELGVVGASAIAFIALFLPWYGVSSGVFSASVTGWSTSYGWLGALLIIAAGAYLLLHRASVNLSKAPVGPAVAILGASVVGTVIVALRWLTLPKGSGGVGGVSVYSYGPRVGIIIVLVVGIVQAFCSLRMFHTSSEQLPWAKPAVATTDE